MKKINLLIFLVFVTFMLLPVQSYAKGNEIEKNKLVITENIPLQVMEYSGYTEEGVIYKTLERKVLMKAETTVYIEQTIRYEKIIVPPKQINFSTTIEGFTYKGVLNRINYNWSNGTTTATYNGTLYRQ